MSDTEAVPEVKFNEKEVKMLVAMSQSLKNGPPDIDIQKFTKIGGFNTQKTASNSWGNLKKKLRELNPAEDGDDGKDSLHFSFYQGTLAKFTSSATTPKKKSSKRKSPEKAANEEEALDDGETPKKKAKAKGKGRKKAADAVVESPTDGEKGDGDGE
ncbi:hypothetical protein MBLNU230_g2225t1 [Neophaeotheca triangularis]